MKSLPIASLALVLALSGCSTVSNEPQISPEEQQRIINEETRKKYVAYVECINDTYVSLGKGITIAGVDGTRSSILQHCKDTTGYTP